MGLCGSKSDVETSQSPIEAPVVVQASTEDKPSVADVVEPSVVAAAVPKKLAFQGMLQKKRPGGRGGFQARYCVLDEKALFSYYASEEDFKANKKANGSFSVKELNNPNSITDISKLMLGIKDRVYEFECGDFKMANAWAEVILRHLGIETAVEEEVVATPVSNVAVVAEQRKVEDVKVENSVVKVEEPVVKVEEVVAPVAEPAAAPAAEEAKSTVDAVVEEAAKPSEERQSAAPMRNRTIQGVLQKKKPGMMGGYQSRFCVLDSEGLFAYYTAEEDFKAGKKANGEFKIKDINNSNSIFNDTKVMLGIEDRVYEFDCGQVMLATAWCGAIESHLTVEE